MVTQPPGQASPLHVHTREAEAWFLLQGTVPAAERRLPDAGVPDTDVAR